MRPRPGVETPQATGKERQMARGWAPKRAAELGRSWTGWLRVAVGVSLLLLVLWHLDLEEIGRTLAQPRWTYVGLAALAQFAAKLAVALRWRETLLAAGLYRRLDELVRLVYVGCFFNLFLPTSIGGDTARGYYVAGDGGSLSVSYSVLLVERLVGLVTLGAVVTGTAGAMIALDTPLLNHFLWACLAFGLLTAVVASAFVAQGGRWVGWIRAVGWLPRKARGWARDLARTTKLFRRPGGPLTRVVWASLAIQVITVCFYLACARAVGITVPIGAFFLIVPLSFVASLIPISLNGLGLREGTLSGLLVAYGADAGSVGACIVLALVVSSLFSLAGGPVYVLGPGDARRSVAQTEP